jgi:hypothetical protein
MAATRRLACARCGTHFDCSLGGVLVRRGLIGCLPDSAVEDCLCPTCLRSKAAAQRPQS